MYLISRLYVANFDRTFYNLVLHIFNLNSLNNFKVWFSDNITIKKVCTHVIKNWYNRHNIYQNAGNFSLKISHTDRSHRDPSKFIRNIFESIFWKKILSAQLKKITKKGIFFDFVDEYRKIKIDIPGGQNKKSTLASFFGKSSDLK